MLHTLGLVPNRKGQILVVEKWGNSCKSLGEMLPYRIFELLVVAIDIVGGAKDHQTFISLCISLA